MALSATDCSKESTSSTPACVGSSVLCDGSCTTLRSDNLHCGACDNACQDGLVCAEGQCQQSCPPNLVSCGGSCIDPKTNPTFCGADAACSGGDACVTGSVCNDGICELSCGAGHIDCGSACIDPSTDPAHCGAGPTCSGAEAGAECPPGVGCVAGTCAAVNLVAEFSATPPSGVAPLDVQLTDTSTGSVSSIHWDFGDGEVSDEMNPSHLYTTPGRYVVRQEISDGEHSALAVHMVNVHLARTPLMGGASFGDAVATGSMNPNVDSSVDIVSSAASTGDIAWWPVDPSTSNPGAPVTIATGMPGATLFLCDMDGDVDLDVVAASPTTGLVAWFENDGAGAFSPGITIDASVTGVASVACRDIDGDGLGDVIASSATGELAIWRTGVTGQLGNRITIDNLPGVGPVSLGDVDQDGDVDILASGPSLLALWPNDGAGLFPVRSDLDTTFDPAASAFADLDGDGLLDVVAVSQSTGKVGWCHHDSSGTFSPFALLTHQLGTGVAIGAFDVTGAGPDDALFSAGGQIGWVQRFSSGAEEAWHVKNVDAGSVAAPAVAALVLPDATRAVVAAGGELPGLALWQVP